MKKHWARLIQVATWLSAVIAAFVFAPPIDVTSPANSGFEHFGKFVVVILVGLLSLPIKKYGCKDHAMGWGLCSIVLLITGTISFFYYDDLGSKWTGKYEGDWYVIGSDLLPEAKALREHENISNDDLLKAHHGDPIGISTGESIRSVSKWLRITYLLTIIAFAGATISMLQAVECSKKRKQRTYVSATPSPG
jgi:hypothetical protein